MDCLYYLKQQPAMIAAQLPSLQEIYDYSSPDLQKIIDQTITKLQGGTATREQQIKYEDYIENIKIELQERKTLDFFQELCAVDNPYIKKVTDFNNQFLKLAEQAIAAQQHTINSFQKRQLQEISQEQIEHETQGDSRSTTSAFPQKTPFSDNKSYQSTNGYEEKAYTVTSEKRSSGQYEKRTNFGMIKTKQKNNMKDFILNTLNKNKAEGCYVVKKSGPQKPQPAFTVNQRGHLVASNTLQPISMKSIKSSSTAKQKQTSSSSASNKQIVESTNKINEKDLQKKRLEAIDKVKHVKAEKKKQKAFNNKDLLEMVRQEEREKQRKEKKKVQQKSNNVNYKNESQLQGKLKTQITIKQVVQIAQEVKTIKIQTGQNNPKTIDKKKSQQNVEQIKQMIEIEEDKQRNSQSSTQEIKEQIKNQQNVLNVINQKSNQNIPPLSQSNSIKRIPPLLKNEKIQEQITKNEEKTQITPKDQIVRQVVKNEKQDCHESSKQNEFKTQLAELSKMKQQLQQQNIQRQLETQQIPKEQNKILEKNRKNEQFGRIIDVPKDQKPSQTSKDEAQQPVTKKCYNQQYWIHIREQAESQIKRFKQEKQLQELSKKSLKHKIERSMSAKDQPLPKEQTIIEQNDAEQSNSTAENEQKPASEASQQDKFIDKRKMQLAKMINDHNKRIMPKKPPLSVVAPPKLLYALPAFNYLQIYPTFNHIFSVMYTKAEHQALQDIPMIMRDLINMFTTHLQHFKDKNSYFKPAVFLPFDSSNNFQLSDPKQLLLHAENTYVNLKKIVERLQIFNGNLHGQFNEVDNRFYRVVKTKQQVYDIISTGFLRRKGWKQLPHGCSLRSSWNLFWSWSKPDIDISKLLVFQRINHFPFNKNLSRKDLLYKNLDSFRKMLKIPFNFLPLTFNLPKQFTQFSIKFHEQQIINRDLNYWIMKPIGKSRGRGIKVINNLAELNYTDNIIVQKYINNPLLLDGYKFDMRIYVLVTNFHPLQAFVYKQGFARLSTEKFSLEPMFIKNTFVHLTNFAINKNNEQAKQTAAFSGGSKISLKVLKDKITKMGYSFNNIWSQVHQIIIKSLLGCSISVPPFPTAFELFGYDIMIDTEGACHLIQINASPSLQRSYLIDQIVKQSLIDDILDIVDPPNFDKEQLLDIMSERLTGKKKITPQEDLIAIARVLKYKPVRKFGEIPQNIGLFQMIAPSKLSNDLEKQIKGRSGANNPKNID